MSTPEEESILTLLSSLQSDDMASRWAAGVALLALPEVEWKRILHLSKWTVSDLIEPLNDERIGPCCHAAFLLGRLMQEDVDGIADFRLRSLASSELSDSSSEVAFWATCALARLGAEPPSNFLMVLESALDNRPIEVVIEAVRALGCWASTQSDVVRLLVHAYRLNGNRRGLTNRQQLSFLEEIESSFRKINPQWLLLLIAQLKPFDDRLVWRPVSRCLLSFAQELPETIAFLTSKLLYPVEDQARGYAVRSTDFLLSALLNARPDLTPVLLTSLESPGFWKPAWNMHFGLAALFNRLSPPVAKQVVDWLVDVWLGNSRPYIDAHWWLRHLNQPVLPLLLSAVRCASGSQDRRRQAMENLVSNLSYNKFNHQRERSAIWLALREIAKNPEDALHVEAAYHLKRFC